MKASVMKTVCAALALFGATAAYVAAAGEPVEPLEPLEPLEPPQRPTPFKPPQLEDAAIPQEEPTLTVPHAGFATPSAFNALPAAAAPASQTLSGPVTLSYSGTANAFSVTQGGTGRGVGVVDQPGVGAHVLQGLLGRAQVADAVVEDGDHGWVGRVTACPWWTGCPRPRPVPHPSASGRPP